MRDGLIFRYTDDLNYWVFFTYRKRTLRGWLRRRFRW